jgi:hypothetical protein
MKVIAGEVQAALLAVELASFNSSIKLSLAGDSLSVIFGHQQSS